MNEVSVTQDKNDQEKEKFEDHRRAKYGAGKDDEIWEPSDDELILLESLFKN
jgi:hypothetical protein